MAGNGFAGFVLEVNLTTRCFVRKPLPQAFSGKTLAARLLWDAADGWVQPFSEESPVVVAAALLTGTGAPGSNRFDLASLSPKDGLPAFSNCGGAFGLYLKKAGYDALILKGKSETPVWVEISGETVRFHDARQLVGLGTGACRSWLEETLGKKFASLCIGPAGEHLVKFASLVADGHSTGRAGLGAVLGWKKLKAVTVSGQQELPVFNPEGVLETNRQWHTRLRETAREPEGVEYCRSCPLHCARHRQAEEALLNELGMDAFGAETARKWAEEQRLPTETLYEDIAFRRGIGESLAEGRKESKNKGGKRRGGSYGKIAQAFGLSPEEESTEDFCRNFAEAVSVCGQCIFTANAFPEECYPLKLLEQVTGEPWDISQFLALGQHSRNLEKQLKDRFRM